MTRLRCDVLPNYFEHLLLLIVVVVVVVVVAAVAASDAAVFNAFS